MEKESNFEIIYLFQTKAQSCYGCGTKFIRNEEQHNLIARKYCEREYVQQGEKKKKWQFAYFHLRNQCVTQKFPDYKKEHLVISREAIVPTEVKEKLIGMGINV